MKDLKIRLEKEEDYLEVANLIRDSFYNVYRPGCYEHYLIKELRKADDFIHELNYVLEKAGKIIGQICFVKAKIETEKGEIPIMTFGPVCISKDCQKQGYGKLLIDYALNEAKNLGYGAVCIEGNINFYKHCGFGYGRDFHLKYAGLPEGMDDSFFLCKELKAGYLEDVKGIYHTPNCYFIDEKAAEVYDEQFPYKEKLKLEGQLV